MIEPISWHFPNCTGELQGWITPGINSHLAWILFWQRCYLWHTMTNKQYIIITSPELILGANTWRKQTFQTMGQKIKRFSSPLYEKRTHFLKINFIKHVHENTVTYVLFWAYTHQYLPWNSSGGHHEASTYRMGSTFLRTVCRFWPKKGSSTYSPYRLIVRKIR